ncbi:MAG: efflux RND transporter permease subunit [Burkholderiales bacterium]|jgi:hypothetical protein|nr:efflux RND transporter permease subunit [Burkholderiales bacterium]
MDTDQLPVGKTFSWHSSLLRALWFGLLLIFFDAFLFDSWVISILVIVAVFLKFSFAATRYGLFGRPFSKLLIRNYTIYVAAAVLALGINIGNNILARHRAENIVAAIEAYHVKYGDYPKSLEVMAPEFMGHIPLAKYNLSLNTFYYRYSPTARKNEPTFFYTIIPPFYRNFYDFEKREWRAMD